MEKNKLSIQNIPSILWGDEPDKLYLFAALSWIALRRNFSVRLLFLKAVITPLLVRSKPE